MCKAEGNCWKATITTRAVFWRGGGSPLNPFQVMGRGCRTPANGSPPRTLDSCHGFSTQLPPQQSVFMLQAKPASAAVPVSWSPSFAWKNSPIRLLVSSPRSCEKNNKHCYTEPGFPRLRLHFMCSSFFKYSRLRTLTSRVQRQ